MAKVEARYGTRLNIFFLTLSRAGNCGKLGTFDEKAWGSWVLLVPTIKRQNSKEKGAVAKFTGFQRVLPVPLLLENLTGNLF